MADSLAELERELCECRACPRLVAWREQIGREKRAAFRDWDYWARPVPSFGDRAPRVLIVGLAPAAHGANRTGRMFTGDRSGDFLFAALHRTGFANRPTATTRDDGLRLTGCRITAALHCAPPRNRPTAQERARCAPFLMRELALCPTTRVVVALGALAWNAVLACSATPPSPRPRFGHAARAPFEGITLLGCYHPSQHNTFTGRLTPDMLDTVLSTARELGYR